MQVFTVKSPEILDVRSRPNRRTMNLEVNEVNSSGKYHEIVVTESSQEET
jgi:hypothetical protein